MGGALAVPLAAVGLAAMGVHEGVKDKNAFKAVGFGALGVVGGLIIGPLMVVDTVFGIGLFEEDSFESDYS